MDKQEFIEKLRIALSNELIPSMVTEHVKYYEGYIDSEMQKGKSEETVMTSLGDPRLIARTIIQTNTTEEGKSQKDSCQNDYYQQTVRRDAGAVSRRFSMPGWLWGVVIVLALVILIGFVLSVLSFLAPILIPIIVVFFLVKLFRDWLN